MDGLHPLYGKKVNKPRYVEVRRNPSAREGLKKWNRLERKLKKNLGGLRRTWS